MRRQEDATTMRSVTAILGVLALLCLSGCSKQQTNSTAQASVPETPTATQAGTTDLIGQGQAYYEHGDPANAIACYEAALKQDPNNADLKRRLSVNYCILTVKWAKAGNRYQALQYAQAAVNYDPTN